ncbi:MAG: GntR family transcriptional regulator [Eubacteriales bacterium]|nr:GntR family transcriptional regulator [Eubacteriales bacterium]
MDFYLKNSLPIWKQLAARLRERIVTGEYPAGGHFPSVRELAAEAEVNPNTMQRAMSQLEAEGLLVTNRNFGRTVTEDAEVIAATKKALAKERAAEYLESMKALGFTAEDADQLLRTYIGG